MAAGREEEDARQCQNQRVGSGRGLHRHGRGGSGRSRQALCPAPARRALPLRISSHGGRFWHVAQVQMEEHLCLHSHTGERMDFCALSGQDVVSWCWTTDGMYTTRSTYKAMFWGSYLSTCSQTF